MLLCLSQDEEVLYCGEEVRLMTSTTQHSARMGPWYRFDLPLSAFACDRGSAGGLANVNRVDFMNPNLRDANICLDGIALLPGGAKSINRKTTDVSG